MSFRSQIKQKSNTTQLMYLLVSPKKLLNIKGNLHQPTHYVIIWFKYNLVSKHHCDKMSWYWIIIITLKQQLLHIRKQTYFLPILSGCKHYFPVVWYNRYCWSENFKLKMVKDVEYFEMVFRSKANGPYIWLPLFTSTSA